MEILYGLRELNSLSKNDTAVLFGSSFNPPHLGHLVIFNYAFNYFDADFYILPTKNPPHKAINVPFEKRFEWAVKTFQVFKSQYKGLYITDLEKHIEGVNYAIYNVEYFLNYYRNVILLIGEDALGNIEKWFKYEELLRKSTLAVYPRTRDGRLYKRGHDVLGELYDKVLELDFPIIEISSSDIRRFVREGKSITGLVPTEIEDDVIKTYQHLEEGERW
ncbi:nicotinate-nicotinamide nucleotide adenylyltransferase [Fervidobacterium riparium]|uniref:Probable nicotinate-nucleotide adenylyltransferase n=1 Tax=Fervidobacterium gondwanense DSM 13020 TaxID=1121883 RepID=A0A1M7S504_FERGO|nr:nicotinate-nicotinamide nucleotide adenylyltransferase [Fervidobacterium gondwanense]UXF00797.1 nicotinate-nucleotide adenylyltransferase [Fervidobacterium riparium]SHN53392.1 nicotinate-nucleotide adenylyltransferase [Fervidobacterium gondwanense DSM 13020]